MRLDTRWEEGQTIVAVHGALDGVSTTQLRAELTMLREVGVRRVVIDLEDATLADTAAVTGLLISVGRFHAMGAVLALRAPSPEAQAVIDLTGLSVVMSIDR